MLDDKIFVNKCESSNGVWNYTNHSCEGLWNICSNIGGINIQEDIMPPCTGTGIIDDYDDEEGPLKLRCVAVLNSQARTPRSDPEIPRSNSLTMDSWAMSSAASRSPVSRWQ